jgi:hypothetical protein
MGASSSSRAKPPSWDSPQTRSNGTIEGWAEAIAYELEPFGIEVILMEPVPTGLRSGKVRRVFSRPAAHIMHGYSRCSGQAMHMPRVWRATRTRWLSSLPTPLRHRACGFAIQSARLRDSITSERQGAKSLAAQSNETLFGSASNVALILGTCVYLGPSTLSRAAKARTQIRHCLDRDLTDHQAFR